ANFDTPYRARSLPEFWRRWHISLSTWLRDYVFAGFASRGRRHAAWLYAGLFVTMLTGGLWHGAAWTFVLWGMLHGLGLIVVRLYETLRRRMGWLRLDNAWTRGAAWALTFHYVCLTWVFFRAETVAQARAMLRQMFTNSADVSNLTPPVAIIIVTGLALHYLPDRWWEPLRDGFVRLPAPAQAATLTALGAGLYLVASADVAPFIYSRF
ncbi:MAG: MBOAT family O-acyltransferase, partial [Blastocatellia bacterium]